MKRWLKAMNYTDAQAAEALGYGERSIRLFKQDSSKIPVGTRKLMTALKEYGEIRAWRV